MSRSVQVRSSSAPPVERERKKSAMFSRSGGSGRGVRHLLRRRALSFRLESCEDHKEKTTKAATNAVAGHMRCGYYRRVRFLRHLIVCVFVRAHRERAVFRTNLA